MSGPPPGTPLRLSSGVRSGAYGPEPACWLRPVPERAPIGVDESTRFELGHPLSSAPGNSSRLIKPVFESLQALVDLTNLDEHAVLERLQRQLFGLFLLTDEN